MYLYIFIFTRLPLFPLIECIDICYLSLTLSLSASLSFSPTAISVYVPLYCSDKFNAPEKIKFTPTLCSSFPPLIATLQAIKN